jgi:hypothetical protein
MDDAVLVDVGRCVLSFLAAGQGLLCYVPSKYPCKGNALN